jgi:N-acetylglucosaminyldiphosphoundecaprenol N-acetyl-beta-D-mannosaminyltransferase
LRSLLYYAGLVHEAKSQRVKACIFAQGVGPLSVTGKLIVRNTCANVDLAIARDRASEDLMRALLPRVDVRLGADPVFLASDVVSERAEHALAAEGIPSSGALVAVVVRPSRVLPKVAGEIARAVDLLINRYNAQVIFIPFQPGDGETAVSIIRRCKGAPVLLSGGYNLATMTALFKRCSAVIGMRLHALILAARLGVPFVSVPYDPKISALTDSLRYSLAPLQPGNASEVLAELDRRRESLVAQLQEAAATQAQLASKSFDWLAALVEGAVA